MKFNVIQSGVAFLLMLGHSAGASDFQARGCEFFPVSAKLAMSHSYGRSANYRNDTYFISVSFKIGPNLNTVSNQIQEMGFRLESGQDIFGYYNAEKKTWDFILSYYEGGFYGFREHPMNGVFYMKVGNPKEPSQSDTYWLQRAPYENMSLSPQVKLGKTSWDRILPMTSPTEILDRINVFQCR